MKITVVGGGLAGLAAALECADGGAEVTLLEARPRLGGATFSIKRNGLWMDNGQHVFLRCCTAYRRFLDRLGATGDTVLQQKLSIPIVSDGGRVTYLRRSSLPAPLHLAAAVARFPFLSPADKLAFATAGHRLSRLDLADPSLDDEAFGDWLRAQGQSRAAIAALWDLIVLPTINLPSDEASLALAAKVFQTGLFHSADAGDVGYAAVPLQQLHGDAAKRALEEAGGQVRMRAPVERLEDVEADAVVLAVPHDVAALLLGNDAFAGLGFSPIVNLHVVYDRRVTDLPFAAGHRTPVQWVFDRTASSGLAEGQYLAVSLSGAFDHIRRKVDDLRDEFVPALERLFPAARSATVDSFFATREQRATFRQGPGTRDLRPGSRTDRPGVFLAGAWTDTGWPATMEGAVRSGLRAAREALAHVGAREKVAA